jgi:type I restriction enzyme M protein
MNKSQLEDAIGKLGFTLLDGEIDEWINNVKGYEIKISLKGNEIGDWFIDYGVDIKIHRKTTINFTQAENLVVLECVLRLLNKGYSAKHIELEKKWRVGGFLDIFVTDNDKKAFLMVECKTWGKEFNNASKILLENTESKEQILNYYVNDKNAKYLILYTSKITPSGKIEYLSNIITTDLFKTANNQKEVYDTWDKVFYTKGVFEDEINPYNIKFLGITRKDLKSFDHSYLTPETNDDGSIFNRFAEILRRHTISDKSNAYNKIFNLFLCKIVDEDNAVNDNYEMEFQWKYNEQAANVIYRLSDLYKKGMKEYMGLDIADVSENDFDKELLRIVNQLDSKTQKIKEMFKQLRLYKNNEFAFKEVIDERTFNENSEIVKEVIKLLEPYQIKYEYKQQFLGDFFERLLNIGVKQEAGQFFTPMPITSFICSSIPFENIVSTKIQNKDNFFLPYVIDFACGSGHFLTDAIDRIDKIFKNCSENVFKTKTQKDNFYSWTRSYKWANVFIYGIEKDYRLAKTTKVACFLNGDGEANIFYADGLAPFSSELYRGKLSDSSGKHEISTFDVVVANPPFSVENFKMVLQDGSRTFELYNNLSDKSDDIECFFVERTSQLLKEGGYAGIILPSTFLLNHGIQQKARKILVEKFRVVGICEFGTKTFTYAGQPTIAVFLEKRNNSIVSNITMLLNKFIEKKSDFVFDSVKNIVHSYLEFNPDYDDFEDFIEKINDSSVWSSEKEKLTIYMLNLSNQCVIANSGDKDKLKLFLGYEHSSMTKYEGIHPYPHNTEGKIYSKLTDHDNVMNENKLNSIIYKNYLREEITVPEELNEYTEIKTFNEMLDFSGPSFDYKIYTQALCNPYLNFKKYPLVTLNNTNSEILDHLRKPIKKSKRGNGSIPYYGANGRTGKIDDYIFNEKLVLIGEDGAKWGKGESTAFIIEGKSWVNNHAHVIRAKKSILLEEYLVLIFCRLDFGYLKTRPNGGKLQKNELIKIKFPLPDNVKTQKSIVDRVDKIKENGKWDLFDSLLA